ncbi:MAG TPA: redoxin family protein [Ramlibacter sp.]|jgi:thiol-disulfide isomerase/thioredoxin|nr:redoxin family protein [Ramlibacter sp.]
MDMNTRTSRRALLGTTALALTAWPASDGLAQSARSLFDGRRAMPEPAGAVAWLNSKPLRGMELRGKVVMVQFWTFTCVNWLRTLPYVNAWSAKYKDHGLVVIGVHTPEFSFEGDVANVREACGQLQIAYPVAVDSNQSIWKAFANSAWPALYLADANGMIRYQHDGEGEYGRTEQRIQQLLAEAGAKDIPTGLARVTPSGVQAAADWATLQSPETYTGYQKADRFRSPGGLSPDRSRTYELPRRLASNDWAAKGEWTFASEAARSEVAGASIVYRFHARDVNMVMGAATRDRPVPFRVRIDGKAPGSAHGSDIDREGRGVIAEKRLYQLVRQAGAIDARAIEVEFMGGGAEVYAFTFG